MKSSEFVTIGHPDRLADYISSYILDEYLKKDQDARYAVEVQVKDNFVTLGGEVTSRAAFTNGDITAMVHRAIEDVGYTHKYAERWPAGATIDADDIRVSVHIGQQSRDIAQGVNRGGWGDQGIFWGMAVDSPETDFMPVDHWLASKIGQALYADSERLGIGIDIKTQVTMEGDDVREVVVAAPMCGTDELIRGKRRAIDALVRGITATSSVIINGTGAYTIHGPMGDCGTTGRKLAVDFYGGNCRIGGGSPWTKDGTKADVALNLYARKLALKALKERGLNEAHCSIHSCIGRQEIGVTIYDGKYNEEDEWTESRPAPEIVDELGLKRPVFTSKCRNGLFT